MILDDAVSTEQVRPLMPGASSSLIIVTSRRRLIDLEDSRAINLNTLAVREAALLFVRLADRNGLDAEAPQAAEIVQLCGCLPLTVGIQARRLHHHPTWTLADLARFHRWTLKVIGATAYISFDGKGYNSMSLGNGDDFLVRVWNAELIIKDIVINRISPWG